MVIVVILALVGALVVQSSSPAQTSGSARVIYDDAFAVGFSYNQWNGTNNITNTSPVQAGTKSISTKPDAYGGIFIDIADGVPVSSYASLRFWVHGGASGSTGFRIVPKKNSSVDVGAVQVLPDVPANTWVQVTIQLSALLGSPSTFDTFAGRSFWFVSDSVSRPTIYLDQIELVSTTAATTTTAAVTTTAMVGATTTTVPPAVTSQPFASGAFGSGWTANGSVTPTITGGLLAFPLAGAGSWTVLTNAAPQLGNFGSLRITAQTTLASWEVQAWDANTGLVSVPLQFPAAGTDGFRQVSLPWSQMNPNSSAFSAIYLRPIGTPVELRLKAMELLAPGQGVSTTSSAPPTIAPTTTLQPSPAGTKVVYDDTFGAGFSPNPWNGVNNVAATSPVKVGTKSISTKPDAYGGIFINIADGVRLQDYSTLRLWVNGGAAGSSGFRVIAKRNGSIDVGKPQDFPNIGVNAWVLVSVSMNDLLGTPSAFDAMPERALWFVSDSISRPTINLDQIELVGAATPPSTTIGMATTTTSNTTIPPSASGAVFTGGVLGAGWSAGGSATGTIASGLLNFPMTGTGSWLVFSSATARAVTAGSLRFRVQTSAPGWEAQLYSGGTALPTVPFTLPIADAFGLREVLLPWASLNPSNNAFNAIYVRPAGSGVQIGFNDVSFVAGSAPTTTTIAGPTTTVPTVSGACGSKIRVMPLGDSLTFGLMGGTNASEDSYRGHLFRSLSALGYSLDFVGPNSSAVGLGGDPDHAGFGGYTIGPDIGVNYLGTPSNLSEIVSTWLPGLDPNIIVLTIGTNDLAAGDRAVTNLAQEAANPNGVLAANLAALRLEGLVAKVRVLSPNSVIVIGDVPPSGTNSSGDPNPRKVELNAKASQLGNADPNDRVIYAPTFQRLLTAGFNRSTDLVDGTHMSVGGGQKFAAALQPSVIEALQRSGCLTPATTTTTTPPTTTTTRPPTTTTTTTTTVAPTTTSAPTTTTTTTTTIVPAVSLAVPPGLFPGEPFVVSAASVLDGDRLQFRTAANVVVQDYLAKPNFAAQAPPAGTYSASLVRSGTVLASAPLVVPIPPVVTVTSPDEYYTGYRVLAGVDDASRLLPGDQFRLDYVGAADDCAICVTKPAAASVTFTAPPPGSYQIRLLRGNRTVEVKPLAVRPLPMPTLRMENVQYVLENCTQFDTNNSAGIGLPILSSCESNPKYYPVNIDSVATNYKYRIRVSGAPSRPGDYIAFAGLSLQPDEEFSGPPLVENEIRNIGATYRTLLDGKPVPLGAGLDLIFRGPVFSPPACVPGPDEIRAITGADPLANAMIDGRYTCAGIIVYIDSVTQRNLPDQFYPDGLTPIPNNLRGKPQPVGPNSPGSPPIVTSGRSGTVFEVPYASTIDFGTTGACISVASQSLAYNAPTCDIVVPQLAAYGLVLQKLEPTANPPCLGVSTSDTLEFQPCNGARSQAWSDINPTIDGVNYPNMMQYFPLWTEVRGTPYCMASGGSVGSPVSLRPCGSAIDAEEIWTDARIGEITFVPGTRQPYTGDGVIVIPDVRTEERRRLEVMKEPEKINPIVGVCLAKAVLGLIPSLQGAPVIRSQVCSLRYALIAPGTEVPKQTDHIADAMVSRGLPRVDLSAVTPALTGKWLTAQSLQYAKPKDRSWLRSSLVEGVCPAPRPLNTANEKQDCDEYPFASTTGGGLESYRAALPDVQRNWLLLIPSQQNRSFGGKLGGFYRNADCKIDTSYSEVFPPSGEDNPIETGSNPKVGTFLVVAQNVFPTFSLCES